MVDLATFENARVNITYGGQNGDLPSEVSPDSTDAQVLTWAAETIRSGNVSGIPATANVDLSNFVVDRFAATDARPYPLISIRPKTPFGSNG